MPAMLTLRGRGDEGSEGGELGRAVAQSTKEIGTRSGTHVSDENIVAGALDFQVA